MVTSQEESASCKVVDSLRWRYATKKFDPEKKIPAGIFKQIEEALILSPSSFGLQPWSFVVVTDKEKKAKLPEFSWSQTQPKDCSHLVVICRQAEMTLAHVDRYVDEICAVREVERESLKSYREMMTGFVSNASAEQLENWMSKQCYIALGVLMTVASMLGVDNCPMEGFIAQEYDKILGLNERGLRSVVLCALGYRAQDDKYAQAGKVRFQKDKVIISI